MLVLTTFREESGKPPLMQTRIPMIDADGDEVDLPEACERANHVFAYYLGMRRVTLSDAEEFGAIVLDIAPNPFAIIAKGSFIFPR